MNKRRRAPVSLAFVIAAVLAAPNASFAQVKALMSGGFWAAFQEVLPEFEKTTGIPCSTTRAVAGKWAEHHRRPASSRCRCGRRDRRRNRR